FGPEHPWSTPCGCPGLLFVTTSPRPGKSVAHRVRKKVPRGPPATLGASRRGTGQLAPYWKDGELSAATRQISGSRSLTAASWAATSRSTSIRGTDERTRSCTARRGTLGSATEA